jgi:hypothetical protein
MSEFAEGTIQYAITAIIDGKKIRHREWGPDRSHFNDGVQYIYYDKFMNQILASYGEVEFDYEYELTVEDILYMNWEVF